MFNDTAIIETEGRIIRLWLVDGFKEVVSLSGSGLKYANVEN